jgi:transposase
MAHITGFERDQLLLLLEAVNDYVGADNPVRFIDAFVDGLDLAEAGFGRVQRKATGRPGYAPGDLLKLYVYGYLNRVRSSRRLEAECHRNIEVIWLFRTLKPDFKTIADFRADNRAAFKSVFDNSRCFANGSTCSGANCWRWTGRESRRSTTKIVISPAIRWRSSSRRPTSGWRITSSGLMRATLRKRRRAARG